MEARARGRGGTGTSASDGEGGKVNRSEKMNKKMGERMRAGSDEIGWEGVPLIRKSVH